MLLLLLCGDIETNPGPTRYPCKLCRKPVAKTQKGKGKTGLPENGREGERRQKRKGKTGLPVDSN